MTFPKHLRQTHQRDVLFTYLEHHPIPQTVETIYEGLKDQMDLSTVYRTLDTFQKANLVKEVLLEKQIYYYLVGNTHKHFLICLQCHTISETQHCPFPSYEQQIEQETKFQVTNHPVELFGYCEHCQQQKENTTSSDPTK